MVQLLARIVGLGRGSGLGGATVVEVVAPACRGLFEDGAGGGVASAAGLAGVEEECGEPSGREDVHGERGVGDLDDQAGGLRFGEVFGLAKSWSSVWTEA